MFDGSVVTFAPYSSSYVHFVRAAVLWLAHNDESKGCRQHLKGVIAAKRGWYSLQRQRRSPLLQIGAEKAEDLSRKTGGILLIPPTRSQVISKHYIRLFYNRFRLKLFFVYHFR